MTTLEIELCSYLLSERYGDVIQTVGTHLLQQYAPLPLAVICKNLSLSMKAVKPAVYTLLLQNIAECTLTPRKTAEFAVRCAKVLPILMHSHCVSYCKNKFGDDAETLLDEILFHASVTMGTAIKKTVQKLQESTGEEFYAAKIEKIKDCFVNLAEKRIICRGHDVTTPIEQRTPIQENYLFSVPEINLHVLEKLCKSDAESEETQAKKAKMDSIVSGASTSTSSSAVEEIFWQPNWEQFEYYLRNEAIVKAAADIFDNNAAVIVNAVMELSESTLYAEKKTWTPTTPPVTFGEILNRISKSHNIDGKTLEPYLSVLQEGEYPFLGKADDRSGGVYVVNTGKIIKKLAEEAAANVVQEKFGSKYSRLFRLLLKHKYLEQKQLEELAMISPKDVKLFTYELMEESFITTQEISKTPDYAPQRTIYLFYVDLNAVCQKLLQSSYFTIRNLIAFTVTFRKDHQRLLEKKTRLGTILQSLEQSGAEQDQIDEVSQMISPPEKEELEHVQNGVTKINIKICQIVNTIFILKAHLRNNSCK